MTPEHLRLAEDAAETVAWKKFGPYLADRQWGTVREDYSPDGNAWNYLTHDMARSYAYRWGEDGLGGISDARQLLCLSLALWNGQDELLKERLFGLTNGEGNHGEDVKECYYYLDSTPTHSYMRMLYKYPQRAFPYAQLREENARRSRQEPEFELLDTDAFEQNRYFDVFIEYAKAGPDDLLLQITVHNRGPEQATLHVLPQAWFRNTWAFEHHRPRPQLHRAGPGQVHLAHPELGTYQLYCDQAPALLFCDNDTNGARLYDLPSTGHYFKDGINEYVVEGKPQAINPAQRGTKVAAHYQLSLGPGKSQTVRVRLSQATCGAPFADFEQVMRQRHQEADAFYHTIQTGLDNADARNVQR